MHLLARMRFSSVNHSMMPRLTHLGRCAAENPCSGIFVMPLPAELPHLEVSGPRRQFGSSSPRVGVLPRYLVEDDLRSGTLRRLFPSVELLFDHFRLMYRRDDPRAELYRNVAAVMGEQPLT